MRAKYGPTGPESRTYSPLKGSEIEFERSFATASCLLIKKTGATSAHPKRNADSRITALAHQGVPIAVVAIVAAYGYRTDNARANVRVFAIAGLVIAALGR